MDIVNVHPLCLDLAGYRGTPVLLRVTLLPLLASAEGQRRGQGLSSYLSESRLRITEIFTAAAATAAVPSTDTRLVYQLEAVSCGAATESFNFWFITAANKSYLRVLSIL